MIDYRGYATGTINKLPIITDEILTACTSVSSRSCGSGVFAEKYYNCYIQGRDTI